MTTRSGPSPPKISAAPLSGNWKLLKKRLAASAGASTPRKRKNPESPAPSSSLSRKKQKKQAMNAAGQTKDDGKNDTAISASLALWAEDNDIPAADIAKAYDLPLTATGVPTGECGLTAADDAEAGSSKTEVGKYIAIDCEMVGVGEGSYEESKLARVSIVNYHGHCVLDCFVRPKEKVTDWRTWVSGIRPSDMKNAISFEEAQRRVAELMKDRILVGHALKNDLRVLLIGHPRRDIRDTCRHPRFRKLNRGRTPALKKLAKEFLGVEIQGGAHSSIEDAKVCMLLYRRFKNDFEAEHEKKFPSKDKSKKKGKDKKKKKKKKKK